jgi:hypothetical protein
MERLWVLREVIPEHIGIFEMGLRVTLLGVDEVGELGRVTNEEDGSVVENPVEVTLLSPQLDSKPTRVTSGVSRTRLATDSGEANGCTAFGTRLLEELDSADVRERVSQLEETVGTGTFGVYDTLGDTLTIKVSEKIDVVEVLEEEGTKNTSALSSVWLADGCAVGSGVGSTVFVLDNLSGRHRWVVLGGSQLMLVIFTRPL